MKWSWVSKWWPERAKAIAEIIPPNSTVIDLGGGHGKLKTLLSKPKRYVNVDIHIWNKSIVVADFNKNEYPDVGMFDYIVVQGVLEYLNNQSKFLKEIKKYGDVLIISYMGTISTLLDGSGWTVVFSKYIEPEQKLYYCRKKL